MEAIDADRVEVEWRSCAPGIAVLEPTPAIPLVPIAAVVPVVPLVPAIAVAGMTAVAEVGVRAFTSRIPPPEVTSGFSAALFRFQKLHLLLVVSSCVGADGVTCSGSPRRDLPIQPPFTPDADSGVSHLRARCRAATWRSEEEGLGLGRETADW
jgi:hypothetical protein